MKFIIGCMLMALVTYIPRALPLLLLNKKIKSKFIISFLYYMPYAVLSAMIFPDILYATKNIYAAAAGFLTALALSFFEKSLLIVATLSIAAVFIVDAILIAIPYPT